MRLIAIYHKGAEIAFISHLDIQRTLQRAFRRAKLPLAYSAGFNPHPQLSFASALATGMTSDAEWFELTLLQRMEPETFVSQVNAVMPRGMWLSDAMEAPEGMKTLTSQTCAAEYQIVCGMENGSQAAALPEALKTMLDGEIIVQKRTKGGIKPVDLRPQILRASVEKIEGQEITLRVLGKLSSDGGLRAELMTSALLDRSGTQGRVRIHRTAMYFANDGFLPRLPLE